MLSGIDVTEIEINSKTDGLSSSESLIKIGEEVGELFASYLCKKNIKNKSKSSLPNDLEEGVDVIMCVADYLFKEGYTLSQINDKIREKNIKWSKKING